jgi:hypothetical protein
MWRCADVPVPTRLMGLCEAFEEAVSQCNELGVWLKEQNLD